MAHGPRDFDVPYKVACCLHKSVAEALTEAGIRVPERGGITYKLDGDWECEDCESLWVWWGPSEADGLGEFGPKCFIQMERTFTVLLAWNVCTERLNPCTNEPDGSVDRCMPCEEGEECLCPEVPVPMIAESNKCADNSEITVASETAWIWRARYALETRVPALLSCCLRDCQVVPIGCKQLGWNLVSSEVSGGCSFNEFEVTLKW